jgi:rod shape-determining protein MreC
MMKTRNKLKLGGVILLLVAIFCFINFTGFSENIKNSFYSVSSPIQMKMWKAGANVSNYFTSVFKSENLKSENDKLRFENQELLLKISEFENLKNENQAMKEALNIGLDKEFRLFLAQVIGKDSDKDVILINRGAKDGLSPGFPVVTGQKILIGKITQVYDRFSRVTLITNPDFAFGAKIEIASTTILGEIKGEGKSTMILDRIQKDQEIQQGNTVLTTSLGGVFPDNILIGQVENIIKNDADAYQKAEIQPGFDIGQLDEIFVIINF